MATVVYEDTLRRFMATDFLHRPFPAQIQIRNGLGTTWTTIGTTLNVPLIPSVESFRTVFRFPGALVFGPISLSAGVTYYLMISGGFMASGNMTPLQSRLAYSSFVLPSAVSSGHVRFAYPDNVLMRV